ncbi:hypothetical protein Csa_003055 [Cucumis sativus]|uniref:Uncharacterized protein n=1 Tax=Cucumis sativus TaxID=3659 RepID=A0A0A0KJ08_CUCSA|nr:hypothetical protein Csa_003055 [Cucumis sativus]
MPTFLRLFFNSLSFSPSPPPFLLPSIFHLPLFIPPLFSTSSSFLLNSLHLFSSGILSQRADFHTHRPS